MKGFINISEAICVWSSCLKKRASAVTIAPYVPDIPGDNRNLICSSPVPSTKKANPNHPGFSLCCRYSTTLQLQSLYEFNMRIASSDLRSETSTHGYPFCAPLFAILSLSTTGRPSSTPSSTKSPQPRDPANRHNP
jgi:hypothetical protein